MNRSPLIAIREAAFLMRDWAGVSRPYLRESDPMAISYALAGRLVIAAGCVALTQLPVWQSERRTRADAEQAAKFDVARLPTRLGQWTGADTELDERLIAHVGAISVVSRTYTIGQDRLAMVHLASFGPAEITLPHPPPLCYKNAGWTLGNERWAGADVASPHRLMPVEREGGRALIAYWYQVGHAAAASRGELRQSLQKLRWSGRRWPPLVKVLIHIPVETTGAAADSAADDLSAEIFKWVAENS
jgi:hypothetical protein